MGGELSAGSRRRSWGTSLRLILEYFFSLSEGLMTRILILFFSAIAFVGVLVGGGLPIPPLCRETGFARVLYKLHGNQILFSISTGFLVSIFTWFLVVVLPDLNRRKLLRKRLRTCYLNFRKNVIRTLLLVSDDHDTCVEAISDPMKVQRTLLHG